VLSFPNTPLISLCYLFLSPHTKHTRFCLLVFLKFEQGQGTNALAGDSLECEVVVWYFCCIRARAIC
jgi:hypothetical protein